MISAHTDAYIFRFIRAKMKWHKKSRKMNFIVYIAIVMDRAAQGASEQRKKNKKIKK